MTLAWHDRSSRMRMTFGGDGAKAALNGLLTNAVTALAPHAGQYAAALTPKGKVIALCRVLDRGTDLLVDADAAARDGFVAMIRKFVNPRLARYADITEATGCIALRGTGAAAAVATALGADAATGTSLDALPALGGRWVGEGEMAAYVVRADDLVTPGYDVIASRERAAALCASLAAAGIGAADAAAIESARIARGVPTWGIEIDAETLPQEAGLDALGAIAFDKGCYTGQEVVARIHFRGHVNRHLRWLASATPLRPGMLVVDAEGKELGVVRSATASSARGPLAIAMVRREATPGAHVIARDDTLEAAATVEAIAF